MSGIRLSEFFSLDDEQRYKQLRSFTESPPNGEAVSIDRAISEYEVRYEMSSDVMRSKYESGELKETAEIGEWYMLVKARNGER